MAQRKLECCSPSRSETGKQWTLVGLGLAALALSVASLGTCNFISLASSTGDANQDLVVRGFGIFQYADEDDGRCQDYADRAGGAHAMAKAFGLLAVLSIGGAVLSTLAGILLLRDNRARLAWHTARALFAGGLYSILFTFFLYGSPVKKSLCVDGVDCKFGPGAIIAAVNSVVTAVLAILAMLTAAPQSPLLGGSGGRGKNRKSAKNQIEPVADEEYALGNEDATVSAANSNKPRGGWFGSKSSKVAAGTAGGAALATALAAASKKQAKKTRSAKNVVAKVADGVDVVSDDVVVAAPSLSTSGKRGWFGSSKGKVAAAAAGGGAAGASLSDTITLFGGSSDKDVTAKQKRSGLTSMLRPKDKKTSPDAATPALAIFGGGDETKGKTNAAKTTAETRMELFGLDETDFADVLPSSAAKPASTKKTQKEEKAVTVVNESVGSSCPPCYCLP